MGRIKDLVTDQFNPGDPDDFDADSPGGPSPTGSEPMPSPWEVEASNSGGSSEIPPEGNHPAIFIALIDLGTHDDEYQGRKYENRRAMLCWELSGEFDSAGKPFIVHQDVAVMPKISGKSKLRKILEQWRSKPLADGERLDISTLLGKPCLINVGHGKARNGSPFAKIQGISPLVRGMQAPRAVHEPFSWYYGQGPMHFPDWIPWLYGEPVEDVIGRCKEVGGGGRNGTGSEPVGAGVGGNGPLSDDEIPF